jgi:zinc finger protein
VENLCAPASDPCIEVKHFTRSREEDKLLAIYETEEDKKEITSSNTANPTQSNKLSTLPEEDIDDWKKLEANNEVLEFTTNCSNCNAPCFTNMKVMSTRV